MRKRPSYLNHYDCSLANDNDMATFALFASEPSNFDEAQIEDEWVKAMDEEITMIEKNKPWEHVDCPKDKDVIV